MPCFCLLRLPSAGSLPSFSVPSSASGGGLAKLSGLFGIASRFGMGPAPAAGMAGIPGFGPLSAGGNLATGLNLGSLPGGTANFALPNLPPGLLNRLSLAGTAAETSGALGLGPLGWRSAGPLAQAIESLNAHSAAFAPLSRMSLGPLLHFSSLASLLNLAPGLLGMELSAAGALAALQGLLPAAQERGRLAMGFSHSSAGLTLQNAATAFGVNLAHPDALSQLASGLRSAGGISVPSLQFSGLELANLSGVLSSLANIKTGFGIDPFAPGAALQLQDLAAKLPMRELNSLGAGLPSLGSLKASGSAPRLPSMQKDLSLHPSVPSPPTPRLPSGSERGAGTGEAELRAALSQLDLKSLATLSSAGGLMRSLQTLGITPQTVPCPGCKILRPPRAPSR